MEDKNTKPSNFPKKVFWLLRGGYNVASSRLQGYLIHEELKRSHSSIIDSELILAPPFWLNDIPWTDDMFEEFAELASGNIVIMQKMFGERFESLTRQFRSSGGTIIFVHCDLDEENRIPFLCNTVIVPSRKLGEWYKSRGCADIRVIDDPVEHIWDTPSEVSNKSNSLTIGWIGHSNNWDTLLVIRSILKNKEFSDYKLITISNHESADIEWSVESVKKAIRTFDVAVIPVGSGADVNIKSSNRITMFMAAGIPVIAGNLPAYEDVIIPGQNGFIFDSEEQLQKQLRLMRDPKLRSQIGQAGFHTVKNSNTLKITTKKWVEVLQSTENNYRVSINNKFYRKNLWEFKFKNSLLMYNMAKKQNLESASIILNDLFRAFKLYPTWEKFTVLISLYIKKNELR